MGETLPTQPVLLLMAAFSRHAQALDWARQTAETAWGPAALESERFPFVETSYYDADMGIGLRKQFFAFEQPFDPGELAAVKHLSNDWEAQYQAEASHAEPRPLNLDPGYLTEAKLVLATTKDRDHRIYIGQGMFAEVTLHFRGGGWRHHAWTYPNYQREDYHAFFDRCREYLRERRRSA